MPPISATWLRKNVSTSGPALLADAWPCTWQPSTERSRPRASATRHEYEEHPIAGSLHSSAGSGCEPRDLGGGRRTHATSIANRAESRTDASAAPCPVGRS
jgi:hypothetical protein